MIVLTQPGIKNFNPTRQSMTVNAYHDEYCLAEVPDVWNMCEKDMKFNRIGFWWELAPGHFDPEQFPYEQFEKNTDYNLIHFIHWNYQISMEKNYAMAIHVICQNISEDPIEYWNRNAIKIQGNAKDRN